MPKIPYGTYDVVIIGGGLGGLLTAVILAREGMKVCVLERDKQAGGCLQTFSFHKKVFDSSVHYIGGLGEGHTLWHIFKYAGIMDKLELKAYDKNGFDRIAFGWNETLYPQAIGNENFVKQLLPYFPKEKSSLINYTRKISETGDRFPLYRLQNGDAGEKAAVSRLPLTETLESIVCDPLLLQVLTGNNLLYAGVKDRTPFYMHALVAGSYIHSAHKIAPGSSQISKFLSQELQIHGGVIYRNAAVKELKEENGKIIYARTTEGEQVYGKYFISDIHPKVLLSIIDSPLLRPAFRKRINGLEETVSTFMLNVVLEPGTVPFRNYNIYWHENHNVWAAVHYLPSNWPGSYALFFTEDKVNPGYAESISVLTYMHFKEVSLWQHTTNRSGDEHIRGTDYDIFKEQKAQLLLKKVYQQLPELAGNIVGYTAATPLTYRDYTGSPDGSLYGILKDVNHLDETTIATRTRIPNLLLTGQNVNMHGVLGVSLTAIATCAELTGMDYLLNKIRQ